ncbi:MAG: tripartite tricarboxylate transporter substrate binding protein [Treponema sp.]|nr:tripartite tricarboxylate transporter substrate binding protein [Treponema sp.]
MKRLVAFALVLMVLATGTAFAQKKYPSKPITIVCPWSSGGGTDRTARFMAEALSKELKVPVNVVNKTGGSGAVGHVAGALAAPDGYTILNATFEIVILKYLGYADITPSSVIPLFQFNEDAAAVSVKADSPYKDVPSMIAAIKSKPEGTFLTSGSTIASAWDLPRVRMLMAAGIKPSTVKFIPTQGGAAPAITELLGGHVDAVFCSYPEIAPQVAAGAVRTIGVFADKRNPMFPEIPTLKEQGIDVVGGTWRGFAVPNGTPAAVVKTLEAAFKKITDSQEFKDFMAKNQFGIRVRDSKEFTKFMNEEFAGLEKVMDEAGYLKK